MKSTNSLKRGLAYVRRQWRSGRFGRALAKVDQLLKEWPDNSHLLTMRGNLIQLQENEEGPTLNDAKLALQRAVDLDEESPRALIELAYFCNAAEDDAAEGAKCFAKAIRLSK